MGALFCIGIRWFGLYEFFFNSLNPTKEKLIAL
jgi:hypothetical protein